MLDYIRIACAVNRVKVGDVAANVQDICGYMEKADAKQADVLLLPELALTGYTCADLFWQDALWNAVAQGMRTLLQCSEKYPQLHVVVGLPVRLNTKLLNCAAVLAGGKLRGIVPKTYLTEQESRWFASGDDLQETAAGLDVFGLQEFGFTSLGTDLLFEIGDGAVLGIELCEDLNAPVAPSTLLALNGANVILNPAASNELIGKRARRSAAVERQSAACRCIYAYCSAGSSESTSDTVYSGHSLIAENGRILLENADLIATDYMIVQDCDLGKVKADRRKDGTFRKAAARFGARQYLIEPLLGENGLRADGSLYPLRKLVFVPETEALRAQRSMEIFRMQVSGLKQRLSVIGAKPVIGISGGLDSTLALLVAVEAMRQLGRPASDVYGITMPCFGTSDRTYRNAWELMRKLGITCREISIKDAVTVHFKDIGHDPSLFNGTYENSQARERTQILMDFASTVGGIVVGTGDLSELALGWCTYNGDHMSMYGVNAAVPKTVIRWMIHAIARLDTFACAKDVLEDILDTPISPELLPPDASGKISQYTEDLVGPYALHDFFLYHMLRYGFAPGKIYTLACRAFCGDFDGETVKKWLKSFYRRFFTQQFKRSCMPDGVKIGSVGLGPRGDWCMPSDVSGRLWLEEVDTL